ncbi:MAG: hypothetical protein DI529_07165 [Chryseobacterium sp.]|nr:MAG: hypothetical protein DI529_07165 [Chryseobacterium sp.]
MKFRYDINALRALAVILVVFYHFNIPYFIGGYSGVDIFFVISGYLMSKIILKGFSTDTFSFIDFYFRRAKRIVPALVILVLFTVLIGNFFFFPTIESKTAEYGISSIFFISNIVYYYNSGYFDLSSKTNALLHTWSLSVEWQFYLIYPILLFVLKTIYHKNRMIFQCIIISLIIIGFSSMLYMSNKNPSFSFYSLTSRYWEMLIGCLIVLNEEYIEKNISIKIRKIISLICFVIIIYFVATKNDSLLWPGIYTLIPVICTALIIVSNVSISIFKLRLIQYMGKISYSLYLWHWVIFVLFSSIGFENLEYVPLILLLSLLMAHLSYSYIEKYDFKFNKSIIYLSISGILISTIFYFYPISKFVYGEKELKLADFAKDYKKHQMIKQFKTGECFLYSKSKYEDYKKNVCLEIDKKRKNVLLIGDSHAAHLSYSLNKYYKKNNINFLQATTSYCFPIINPRGREENVKLVNYIFSDFVPKNNKKIDLVIISANWKDMQGYTYYELKNKIGELIKYFEDKKLNYIFLGQTETYKFPFPEIIAKKQIFSFIKEENFISKNTLETRDFLLKTIPKDKYIDLYKIKSIKHLSKDKKTPYIFDDNHFTTFGTEQIVEFISSKYNIL